MKEQAELACYRLTGGERDKGAHVKRVHAGEWDACDCPATVECEWKGSERGVALVCGDLVMEKVGKQPTGKTFSHGGLNLQVVGWHYSELGAGYCDAFDVMLAENPWAELTMLYRRAAHFILRRAVSTEARIRGFLLQPVEGRPMTVATWIAEKLL